MKPKIEDYKILYMHQRYFVLDPYDLHTMPAMKISGRNYSDYESAHAQLKVVFEMDMSSYERLKAMGRSFPDND